MANQEALIIKNTEGISADVNENGELLVSASDLQQMVQLLGQLVSAMNAGSPALRIIPIASVSTAVTGSVTATVASTVVSSLTNFGTGIPAKEMADDINNMTVQLSNINNITP